MIALLRFLIVNPIRLLIRAIKPRKVVILKSGDIVFLKGKYAKEYPQLPGRHPMHVTAIENEMVQVYFMDAKSLGVHEIKVPRTILQKAKR